MPGYAGIFPWNIHFRNPVCVPDVIHFTRAGKGIVIHCAFEKNHPVDPVCDHPAKIHGCDGSLPCRTDRRCDIGPDNKCRIRHYYEKSFA